MIGSGKTLTDLSSTLSAASVRKKSLKMFKAIQLYQDAILTIRQLTEEELVVDEFFLKLLSDVVSLNQPRTSWVPASRSDLTIDLKDMSSLEDLDRRRRVIICVDDRFDEIQGLGQNYTETIQKTLSALGPLKRNELELLFRQWEFLDLFSQADVLVLMSEGTLKHSIIWKRLFHGIELTEFSLPPPRGQRILRDLMMSLVTKSFDGSFSASKFQTFMDCPRKFYFSYVDKITPNVALEKDFDPMVSGTISHKIIEEFHKQKLTEDRLPVLVKEVMHAFIRERNLSLPREAYLQHEVVFNHRCLNGIRFLESLQTILGNPIRWTLEKEFEVREEYFLKGKIDCIGESDGTIVLIDFKSTASAASSSKEVEELESLQLWTYALGASRFIKDFHSKDIILGYVSLDKPSESNLLTTSSDLADKIKVSKLCRQQTFEKQFPEIFQEAKTKISAVVSAIRTEERFPPTPRKPSVCRLCELNKVCVKSEIIHE
jgi:CRISPR/Cas system-associated exonuclease Cas4 (RecB family)